MFRHHPGWYKAVFLKKTQTIILSFDEYNNVLNYDDIWTRNDNNTILIIKHHNSKHYYIHQNLG
jgi:hypothetical protein